MKWLGRLFGNKTKEKVLICVFLALLILALSFPAWSSDQSSEQSEPRPQSTSGQVVLTARPFVEGGSTIIAGPPTPVAALGINKPLYKDGELEFSLGLIGSSEFEGIQQRNQAFASIVVWDGLYKGLDIGFGAAGLQNKDGYNGSHANFFLGFRYEVRNDLFLKIGHFSNAGTTENNEGRNWLSCQYIF